MVDAGELAVGRLDVVQRRLPRHGERLVVVRRGGAEQEEQEEPGHLYSSRGCVCAAPVSPQSC